MPIQMPEFSFFTANRGRPYADSWHCQNISMYFIFLPGERGKSLPTVIEDRQKNWVKQEKGSHSTVGCKKAALVCFPVLFLKSSKLISLLFWESATFYWYTIVYSSIKLSLLNASLTLTISVLACRARCTSEISVLGNDCFKLWNAFVNKFPMAVYRSPTHFLMLLEMELSFFL